MSDGPNPITAAFSMLRARLVRRPIPDLDATATVNHEALRTPLAAGAEGGLNALPAHEATLLQYLLDLETVHPDRLAPSEALAFWINAYNAAALALATRTVAADKASVLRVPGAFTDAVITVAGEPLSLDQIEHGKIRRFRDPRIHGALVCGAVSCPTLRPEPFVGRNLDRQLDNQMRAFVSHGGGSIDRLERTVTLSSVFKWYGRDFTSPDQMPTILPVRRKTLLDAIAPWFTEEDAAYLRSGEPTVVFASYDWALGCSIA